jgi:Flp pilus assembly protein TadB
LHISTIAVALGFQFIIAVALGFQLHGREASRHRESYSETQTAHTDSMKERVKSSDEQGERIAGGE